MFKNPEIEIVRFSAEDVITVSGGGIGGDSEFGGGEEE